MANDIPRLLSVIRGEDGPEGEPLAPDPEERATAGLPAVVPIGDRMNWAGQACTAIRYAWLTGWHRMRALSRREGGLIHAIRTWKPPSIDDQAAYAASKAWVPLGHEGGISDKSGTAYQSLVGKPAVAVGVAWIWVFSKPFHAAVAAGIFIVCAAVLAVWSGLI